MTSIYVSENADKRMIYACDYLRDMGYYISKNENDCDYKLPLVTANPNKTNLPYMVNEQFLISNAFLTAEAAICCAKDNSEFSLLHSSVLITGFGRISKALLHLLTPYTNDITVCVRKESDMAYAAEYGAKVISFDKLMDSNSFNYVFNTVPHPILNDKELMALSKNCIIIDLASFPGGVDKHMANARNIKLIEARGLPGKYSPKTAGKIIAQTVDKMIKEASV